MCKRTTPAQLVERLLVRTRRLQQLEIHGPFRATFRCIAHSLQSIILRNCRQSLLCYCQVYFAVFIWRRNCVSRSLLIKVIMSLQMQEDRFSRVHCFIVPAGPSCWPSLMSLELVHQANMFLWAPELSLACPNVKHLSLRDSGDFGVTNIVRTFAALETLDICDNTEDDISLSSCAHLRRLRAGGFKMYANFEQQTRLPASLRYLSTIDLHRAWRGLHNLTELHLYCREYW